MSRGFPTLSLPASFVLVAASLLAGCPSDSARVYDFSFASDQDARTALASVDLPYLVAFALTPHPDVPAACPSTTRTSSGWSSTGGCTDDQGVTWEGTVTVRERASSGGVDYVFEYSAFGSTATTHSTIVDGTITARIAPSTCGFPGPSPLEADRLVITVGGELVEGFGGFFPGAGETATLTFEHYRFTWDRVCDPWSLTARGDVTVDDRGTFAIESDITGHSRCEQRDDRTGRSRFRGRNELVIEYDGDERCDGCLPFATDDSATSGTLCWEPSTEHQIVVGIRPVSPLKE
jgi:hypothetical protein